MEDLRQEEWIDSLKRILLAAVLLVSIGCTPAEHVWWYHATDDEKHETTIKLITDAADEFGVDHDLMIRIARCESGLRWNAYNRSGASGLFQHMKQYWAGRAAAIGEPEASIMDPRQNARAAAWMLSTQGTSPWYPSKHCWSR